MLKTPLFILILSFLVVSLYGGTTGKIAGVVTDSESGEALIGVNIYLEGTVLGAATDIEGFYVINNINPGKYTVVAEAIGYATQKVNNVEVNVDFTTKINLTLRPEVIQGEVVVVEADRPLIRKDLTSTQTSVNADEIQALPVENVQQLLVLQAGIVQGAGGELHVRGGRSTEIAYNVNGVSVSNPYDNSRSVQVATNAIQELSVVSGTFNAEYGNALSGIVNVVTKEGGNTLEGNITVYSGDYISTRDNIFNNIDDLNPVANYVTEFTLSGPVYGIDKYLKFFASARYENDDGYLYGIRQHLPTDQLVKDPNDVENITIEASGNGEFVPMQFDKEISATGKLTFTPSDNIKINYDAIYSNSEFQIYSHALKYNPEANYNRFEWGLMNSLELKHVLSNTTFYNLRGSYNINDSKLYLYPLVGTDGDNFNPGLDFNDYQADPRYQSVFALRNNQPFDNTFFLGGTQNNHFYQRSYTTGIKFDLLSQVNNQHEVKFGFEGKLHKIDYEFFEIKREDEQSTPFIPGLESTDHFRYSKEPVEFSAYVQDKMEFESLILNVGVRLDYIDAKSDYSTDILNPTPNDPDLSLSIDKESLLEKSDPKTRVSPRIGVSFPVSSTGVIRFSYGHFYQIPPFLFLYSNSQFKFNPGIPTYGNANLNPEKQVTYEIGLQQQFTDNISMNIAGYYKDVRDLLALQRIRISTSKVYDKYVNKDYANIKGVTISIIKQRRGDDLIRASLDYTFQSAEGNETNADAFFLDLNSGRQSEKIPVFLNWDQTHTLNASVSVGKAKNWNTTILGRFGTGLPFTPILFDRDLFLETNSDRKPSQLTIDLLAEKTFEFSGFEFVLFMKIFNLFDRLNERFVYDDTGRASYSLEQTTESSKSINEQTQKYALIPSVDEFFVNPAYYQAPREIRLGLSVNF